ncbi:hypothetical protein BCR34DRAFT_608293 [Clohesyomyces aquaticus]|uniref:Phosphoribosyltransferase domain-containing protein n=1 Tax=Clohesyomyces aquaticus TaxID=1231657 RepID=A0A1Y1Y9W9_9PLEO|nr:hypothetical protein BCR34DRAFT_608293 [Clohesyomyces aquaticus]
MSAPSRHSSDFNTASSYAPSSRVASSSIAPFIAVQKPTNIIGTYEVSSCGKTHPREQLQQSLGTEDLTFYEGSAVLDSVVDGGLEAFKKLNDEKKKCRVGAITTIAEECMENICTEADLATFTHIIYLTFEPDVIAYRRSHDIKTKHPDISVEKLDKWQKAEEEGKLRELCMGSKILFTRVKSHARLDAVGRAKEDLAILETVDMLLQNFKSHGTSADEAEGLKAVCGSKFPAASRSDALLVFDADNPLASFDTGKMFFGKYSSERDAAIDYKVLASRMFSKWGYTSEAFRQMRLWFEEVADNADFEQLCDSVALEVALYPELSNILLLVKENVKKNICGVVLTSGLHRVWHKRRSLLGTAAKFRGFEFCDASNPDQNTQAGSKLLLRDMRDVAVFGPALCEAHRCAGFYLGNQYAGGIIGLEGYRISHVLGSRPTDNHSMGYRLDYEKNTLIVALMRDGEPMAFGVIDAFPLAMFKHSTDPADLKPEHIRGMYTVILADSVVNTGGSIKNYTDHIRALN